MDSKNTIAAIALSSAVIVLWALFFVPEKSTVDQNIVEKEKIEQSGDAPSLEQKETQITISRDDALKQSDRIQFENDNIIGSISLKGASIDSDLFIGDDQLEALSKLKSKEELIAEVIGLLQSPAKNVISALQSGGSTIAGIVKTLQEREA